MRKPREPAPPGYMWGRLFPDRLIKDPQYKPPKREPGHKQRHYDNHPNRYGRDPNDDK
jgi:hypothetical protein